MRTIAIVDYKAGRGTYKAYEVDRNEYPEYAEICEELITNDVYKVDIYENDTLVFTMRNSQ